MGEQIEVDLLIKALSEGFDKLSGDLDKLGKSTEAPQEPAKKTGLSFTELKSKIDLVTQSAQIVGGVFKQAFDLTEEGAQLKDTTASLTRLAEASGYTGDLLNDLEKAAGGTVDDFDYMGSTIRLLTGETGAFAKNLAEASPQLLTMARAAVKLNPTLGDTATAYEAITKAIETGQVRALKNYGIVIDATGTKEERLQEILAAMPGLMKQVGGSVETSSDSINRFKQVIDNAKDSLTLFLADGLLPIADGALSVRDAIDKQKEAAVNSNMTFDEYAETMGNMELVVRLLNAAFFGSAEANLAAAQAAVQQEQELERIRQATQDANTEMITFTATVVSAGKAEDDLADTTYRTAEGFYELQAATDGVLGSIDFVSQAGKLLNDVLGEEGLTTSETNARKLEYLYITGEITKAEYEDLMAKNLMIQRLENLNNALAGNIISQEQWQEILRDGIITVQELGQAMAETWSPTLDASIAASTQEFRDMYDVMGDLYYNTDQASSSLVDFVAQAVESGTPLTTLAGGVEGVAGQLATGAQKAKELDDNLTNLDGRTVTATVITNFIANSGGGVGEGMGNSPVATLRVGEPTGGATKTRGGLGDNPYLNDPRFQTMVALGMNPNTALNLLREADGLKGGGLGETSGFPMPSGGKPPIDTGGLPIPSGGGGTAIPPLGSGLVQNFTLNLYSMATTENVTASFAALKAQAGVV